jgi:hypothetical protein
MTMFNFPLADTRSLPAPTRRRSSSGTHRKLGIELMERRLMLSTTSAQLPPVELRGVPVSFVGYAANLQGGESTSVATIDDDDGGYISLDYNSSWNTQTNGTGGQVLSTPVSPYYDPGTTTQFHNSGGGSFSGSPFIPDVDTDGLQPAIIVGSNEDTGLIPNIRPIIAGPPANTPGQSEGGAIPIPSLLTGLPNEITSTNKSLTSSKTSKPVAASTSSVIAGEWARAMVFEIAGGEPGAVTRTPLNEEPALPKVDDASSQNDEPLSDLDAKHPQENPNTSAQGVAPLTAKPQDAAADAAPENSNAAASDVLIQSATNEKSQDANGNASLENARTSNHSNNPEAEAVTEAFDRLGKGDTALVESSTIGRFWSRSVIAMPLLMVLALERIAAANSRRAAREHRIMTASRPQLVPLPPR